MHRLELEGGGRVGRVAQHGDAPGAAHRVRQQLEAAPRELGDEETHPCEIAARAARARDEPVGDGIVGGRDHDGNRRRRSACGLGCGRARGHDEVHADAEELLRVAGEELELPLGIAVPDLEVLPLDPAAIVQALSENGPRLGRGLVGEESDPCDALLVGVGTRRGGEAERGDHDRDRARDHASGLRHAARLLRDRDLQTARHAASLSKWQIN